MTPSVSVDAHVSTLLDAQDNPDAQEPFPVAAAVDYARAVMALARESLPSAIRVTADQAYGPDRLQKFDVYAPIQTQGAPVLVFWHGGGWTHGYRQWVRFMARHATQLGIVLVAPSYRLAPTHPLPETVDDALNLLALLRSRADEWGGNPDRLLLSGHSAGGHLAAMVAVLRQERRERGIPDAAILGCLPISGILDLQASDPLPGSLEERVYTHVLRGRDAEDDVVFSPLYRSSSNTIPFDLTVGQMDSARVRRSNKRMQKLLEAQGSPVALHELADRDHFQTHLDLRAPSHPWYARLHALAHAPV